MIRLGILGAGQLSLMLAEAASMMGIEVSIFTEDKEAPAARATRRLFIGNLYSDALRSFLQDSDLVLFESEFIDVPLIRKAAQGLSVHFFPELSVMEVFQDKLSQKRFCHEQGLPISNFEVLDDEDPWKWISKTFEHFQGKLVLKWSRLGYDGKGNFFIKGSLPKQDEVLTFIKKGIDNGGLIYAEQLIEFNHEIAIVSCRNAQGKTHHYPVVFSEQMSGICLNVKGPAQSLGLPEEICNKVTEISETIGNKGNIVGTYAVELFQKGGEIFVNEIAPRVHNTGHYTQDASLTSQFENHIRAALGWELGTTDCWPYFSMRNLLGPSGVSMTYAEPPVPSETSVLHWYGKKEIRPGRKVGHINTVAHTEAVLSARILDMLQDEEVWVSRLKDFT